MQYKTIKNEITVKQTIKKSTFIGTAAPVENVEEAKTFIAKVKGKYKDANHNAFAYRVGVKNEKSLFSDDREPSKTAGMPIHNAIRSAEITNVAIVVTRYFGGIKLGIGGLIQAYGETARYTDRTSRNHDQNSKEKGLPRTSLQRDTACPALY